MKKVAIIDYGLCNIKSITNALEFLSIPYELTDSPRTFLAQDLAILPGVGAFSDGMKGLRDKDFVGAIAEFVESGKPLLGICLGMQMLMSVSYEFGEHEGLNLVAGEVLRFSEKRDVGNDAIKVPHIGWNGLKKASLSWDKTPLGGISEADSMYFVHSFYVSPAGPSAVLAETDYEGTRFCSVLKSRNLYGCQFHPEKSGERGLMILRNFYNFG